MNKIILNLMIFNIKRGGKVSDKMKIHLSKKYKICHNLLYKNLKMIYKEDHYNSTEKTRFRNNLNIKILITNLRTILS